MAPCGPQSQAFLGGGRQHARGHFLSILLVLLLLAVGTHGTDAEEGTPPADSADPVGVECAIAPRPTDELRALFREVVATPLPASLEASPTPVSPPVGTPADTETVAAISDVWRQYLACLTAGDQARMFALYSDSMVRRQFTVDIAFGVTEKALFDFLAATPVPPLPDQSVPFEPFQDARVLDDGRVAVVGPGEGGRGDVRIFVKEGDRWLLDDWYDLA